MNERNARNWMVASLAFVLVGALLLAGCGSRPSVGALQTESQSVELAGAESVRTEIDFGAGVLDVTSGADKLLKADFTYNVARLKPEVEYTNGALVVRQPEAEGRPVLRGINGFRNEWSLRFNNDVPMEMRVNMGAGTSNLKLAGLSLTRLDVSLGASESTIDLSGDWVRDLDVAIAAGAGNITLRLPKDVGVRVVVEAGLGTIDAPGLTKDWNVYTNAAYGSSDVTLQVTLKAGIGRVNLKVEE